MGAGNQPSPWRHSREFTSPASYFEETEVSVDSFDALTKVIGEIQEGDNTRLLWRGQENASWGLHSSLFRTLAARDGIELSREVPTEDMYEDMQEFPDEDALQRAEEDILRIARQDWRFDSLGALEILARVQHRGGPTRLIDFSFNPYIASWFASVPGNCDESDGRLFALATHGPNPHAAEPLIMLDEQRGGYDLFWHDWETKEERNKRGWGNGSLRRYWVPPFYDNRMLAQNAVFVLDGIPISGMQIQSSFRKKNSAEANDNWKMADLVASGSLYMKMLKPGQRNASTTRNLASTFTIRITASGKRSIRDRLQALFGYSDSSIYPDIDGLCRHLSLNL